MPAQCPKCEYKTEVIDTRQAMEGRAIKRRRRCVKCAHVFNTYEMQTSHAHLMNLEVAALRAILDDVVSFNDRIRKRLDGGKNAG